MLRKKILSRIKPIAILSFLLTMGLTAVPAAHALTHSSNVAYVTDASCTGFGGSGGVEDPVFDGCSIFENAVQGAPIANGGTYTPSGGVSTTFTDVSVSAINAGGLSAISSYDTVILYQVCDIGAAANANALTAINTYLSNGLGKVIIFDGDLCAPTEAGQADYSGFLFPFTSNNPGPAGATGTITFVEGGDTLTTGESLGFVGPSGVIDAVGDSNTFTTNTGGWCEAIGGTNGNGVDGIQVGYARTAKGALAIYIGWDFWATWGTTQNFAFDKTLFDDALNQAFNPDNLPCGVPVTGIKLDPLTATNPVGTSHTVTATVTDSTGAPVPGVLVTFTVTSGPNAGQAGTATTNASGQCTFTYSDTGGAGTDTIVATFNDPTGGLHTSNTATKIWGSTVGVPQFGTSATVMAAISLLAISILSRRVRSVSRMAP